MRNRRTMSSSSYGGLDTSSPSKMTGRSGSGEEEEWLHVTDDTNTNNSSSNNNRKKKKQQTNNNSTTTMEALEMGHDDNEYSIGSSDSDNSNNDSIDYELSDHTPTLSDHLTGRTTFLHISLRQKCIVFLLSLVTIVAIIVVYGYGDKINLLSSILPQSMEIERKSRAFPIWIEQRRAANSSSHPYGWCVSEDLATNDKSPKGLLFVKMPKSSSSTGAGVSLRIRDGLSKRLDRVNKNKTAPGICFAHYRHAVAAKRNFQNRDPAHSFLWSIVREPAQRTLR